MGEIENSGDHQYDVLTFNYDLSFDATLLKAIHANQLGTENLNGLFRVRHVHGQVGALKQGPASAHARAWRRDYGYHGFSGDLPEELRMRSMLELAHRGIRTIGEQPGELEAIRASVREAQRICILGFQFHDSNVDILGGFEAFADKDVVATCFKIDQRRLGELNRKFGGEVDFKNTDCHTFMERDFEEWIDKEHRLPAIDFGVDDGELNSDLEW